MWIAGGRNERGIILEAPPPTIISLWWLIERKQIVVLSYFLSADHLLGKWLPPHSQSVWFWEADCSPSPWLFGLAAVLSLAWPVMILQLSGHSEWFRAGPFTVLFQELTGVLGKKGSPKVTGAVQHRKLEFFPPSIPICKPPLLPVKKLLEWNQHRITESWEVESEGATPSSRDISCLSTPSYAWSQAYFFFSWFWIGFLSLATKNGPDV